MRGRGGEKHRLVSEVWVAVHSSRYKTLFRGHARSQAPRTRSRYSDHLTILASSQGVGFLRSFWINHLCSIKQFPSIPHFTSYKFKSVLLLSRVCCSSPACGGHLCFLILPRDFRHTPQSITIRMNGRRNARLLPTLDSIIKTLA